MFSTDDPAWQAYTSALARFSRAGDELDRALLEGGRRLTEVEREFQEASKAYTSARQRLSASQSGLCDGVRSLQAWFGTPRRADAGGHQMQSGLDWQQSEPTHQQGSSEAEAG